MDLFFKHTSRTPTPWKKRLALLCWFFYQTNLTQGFTTVADAVLGGSLPVIQPLHYVAGGLARAGLPVRHSGSNEMTMGHGVAYQSLSGWRVESLERVCFL